jgi:SAM-dependent methyltransferase
MATSPWKLQPSNEQLLPLLENWFDAEPGKSILAAEAELVEQALNNCFGYNLLQLSVSRNVCLAESCRIQRRYRCHPLAATDTQAEFDQLPIATDSLDAVILHHAHEFVTNPHLVLREMHRVIVPHGRLVIVGFNPWSLLGLYSALARRSKYSMWHNHLLGSRRMTDWLSLLGFQVNDIHYAFHRPPIKKHHLFSSVFRGNNSWIKSFPGGSCYIISALKEQANLIPSKPRWQMPANKFRGLAPVKPSASPGRHQPQ